MGRQRATPEPRHRWALAGLLAFLLAVLLFGAPLAARASPGGGADDVADGASSGGEDSAPARSGGLTGPVRSDAGPREVGIGGGAPDATRAVPGVGLAVDDPLADASVALGVTQIIGVVVPPHSVATAPPPATRLPTTTGPGGPRPGGPAQTTTVGSPGGTASGSAASAGVGTSGGVVGTLPRTGVDRFTIRLAIMGLFLLVLGWLCWSVGRHRRRAGADRS